MMCIKEHVCNNNNTLFHFLKNVLVEVGKISATATQLKINLLSNCSSKPLSC